MNGLDTPNFRVLSEDQMEDLHLASLEVLRRTGVRIYDDAGVNLVRRAGAQITDDNLVRFPAHLVEWALRAAPPSIVIYSRDGQPAMYLENDNVYFGTGPSAPNLLDPFTHVRRPITRQDVANSAKLCDRMSNIDFVMSLGLISDCPPGVSDVLEFEAMLLNTKKPLIGWAYDVNGYEDIIQMAVSVAGSLEELQRRPFLLLYAKPTSPFCHSRESVQKLLFTAELGLPCVYTPGAIPGASCPVTSAATLVVDNVELLAGLVLAQLKTEGTPFVYGGGGMPIDMRTMGTVFGAPEAWLHHAALADMAHYYHLPSWGYGGASDSKRFDEQAAIEGSLGNYMSALSGANLVHDVGYVESAMTASLEMVVVQDEVIGMIKRMMGGIEINEETLALDLIDEVGPGGQFLTSEHTLKHFKENFYPNLMNRDNITTWEEKGSKTLGQRANERVREIIENYRPEQLPQSVRDKLAAIVARAQGRMQERY